MGFYAFYINLCIHLWTKSTHLFSRNVFALETFFPMAEAFHEKYEPDGSTYIVQILMGTFRQLKILRVC